MKNYIYIALGLFFVLPSLLVAQQISEIDLKTQLMVKLLDKNITYEYNEVFQKVNEVFQNLDIKYEDRLIYFSKIFKVLYERINTGGSVIPDSLINLKPASGSINHEQKN